MRCIKSIVLLTVPFVAVSAQASWIKSIGNAIKNEVVNLGDSIAENPGTAIGGLLGAGPGALVGIVFDQQIDNIENLRRERDEARRQAEDEARENAELRAKLDNANADIGRQREMIEQMKASGTFSDEERSRVDRLTEALELCALGAVKRRNMEEYNQCFDRFNQEVAAILAF